MKVLTLTESSFLEHCHSLREMVDGDGFQPDMVIAIATGGVYVAENMGYPKFYTVFLQRPSTKNKKGLIISVIKKLPRWMADMLRIIESRILAVRDSRRTREATPIQIDTSLAKELKSMENPRILIVDDAVDSGFTLADVIENIKARTQNADIRTAVITVTRKSTFIKPAYCIYQNSLLVRFPWSLDS